MTHPPEKLQSFIADFARLSTSCGNREETMLTEGRKLLAKLVAQDDWLPPEYAQPHPQYYRQYLLHLDPQSRFSVVSFVWGPGQRTPVHDHTVWGMIGMLRGAEVSQRYECGAPGTPMRPGETDTLRPGDVDVVSPTVGDVHLVSNLHDDRVSISIHVYGGDIGTITRHVYDPATGQMKDFISGYSEPVAMAG